MAQRVKPRHGQRDIVARIGMYAIVLGMLAMLLPLSLQLRESQGQHLATQRYMDEALQADETDIQTQRRKALEYNRRLAPSNGVLKPLRAESSVEDDDYMGQLTFGGMMAVVRIPSIGVALPVGHGTGSGVLDGGAGHVYGTSLPIGGTGSHTVIAAHRGMPTKLMFTRLGELGQGDVFSIDVLGESHEYVVDRIDVVEPDGIDGLFTVEKEMDYATLLTCTPFGVNTQRLAVRGHRIAQTVASTSESQVQGSPAQGTDGAARGDSWRKPGLRLALSCALCAAATMAVTRRWLAATGLIPRRLVPEHTVPRHALQQT